MSAVFKSLNSALLPGFPRPNPRKKKKKKKTNTFKSSPHPHPSPCPSSLLGQILVPGVPSLGLGPRMYSGPLLTPSTPSPTQGPGSRDSGVLRKVGWGQSSKPRAKSPPDDRPPSGRQTDLGLRAALPDEEDAGPEGLLRARRRLAAGNPPPPATVPGEPSPPTPTPTAHRGPQRDLDPPVLQGRCPGGPQTDPPSG